MPAAIAAGVPTDGLPVYVTSELFGRTFPWQIPSAWPAAVATERLVSALNLPLGLDHEGRVGLRFAYSLARAQGPLAPGLPLPAQGVQPHELLWLSVEVTPFAATAATTGQLGGAVFRAGMPPEAANALRLRAQALGLARARRRWRQGAGPAAPRSRCRPAG